MKNKRLSIFLLFVLVVSALATFDLRTRGAKALDEVVLKLSISRKNIQLGEMISIRSEITNSGSVPVFIEGDSEYAVAIKIAPSGDKDYKLYVREGRAISQEAYPDTKINPGDTFVTESTIFWNRNSSSEVRNLSKEAAESYIGGKILTDYAFPDAGSYEIKAVTSVMKNGKPVLVESEPITISVVQPQGDDLAVWNLLKRNGDIGYLLHVGDVPRTLQYKTEERHALLKEIDSILKEHPNSFYTTALLQSLEKFRVNEAKRQDIKNLLPQKPL